MQSAEDRPEAGRRKEHAREQSALVKRMKNELNSLEIDIYRSRSERYPKRWALKFELALRLKLAGKYNEAIKLFQEAGGDAKRKAKVHMELGECFQQIKQYKLAMQNYEGRCEATAARSTSASWPCIGPASCPWAWPKSTLGNADPASQGRAGPGRKAPQRAGRPGIRLQGRATATGQDRENSS